MKRSAAMLIVLFLALCAALGAPPPPLQAAGDIGYVDFSFGSAPGGNDPTADKPQSKLWHNDGAWWAVMFHTGSSTWHIFRLSWPNQWIDTGVVVDDRAKSRADALWDGNKLYVASLIRDSSSNVGRLYRYSYNTASDTYTLDSGFPANIMTGKTETLAFDKDSTGQLWITYTQSSKVYVNRTVGDDATWGVPFVIPGAANVSSDDISSLVAYQNNIGVLWSNQSTDTMNFSYHRDADADNLWQPIVAVYSGSNNADDHINLKSLQSDNTGRLFAAIKTSQSGSNPLMVLVWRDPDGTWGSTVYSTAQQALTRPLVLLDSSNNKLYMFASTESGGTVYMKSTSMDNPDFSNQPGLGEPFIQSNTYNKLNNVTSTKQTLSAATGLVVLVSDESKRFYLHNAISLGTAPPDTTPPAVVGRDPAAGAVGVDVATNVTATFSEAVTGVSGGSFTLTPQGGAAVAASVTYDANARVATLNPTANLAPGTIYTAALSGAIADTAGNPLAPLSWSFTTLAPPDTTPPTVTAVNPPAGATGVSTGASISATLSEPINSATINGGNVTLRDAGQNLVPAAVSYDVASRTVTIQPNSDLAFSETYIARLSGGITDIAGNPLAPFSWSFTTAAAPDTTAPTVVALSPPSGATGVSASANVVVTFSEAIDATTIGAASFKLTRAGSQVPAVVSYNPASMTATLDPAASLAPGATYTARIEGARDLAGNSLTAAVTWSFATAPEPAPEALVYVPLATK